MKKARSPRARRRPALPPATRWGWSEVRDVVAAAPAFRIAHRVHVWRTDDRPVCRQLRRGEEHVEAPAGENRQRDHPRGDAQSRSPRADADFCTNPDPGYSDRFLAGAKVWVAGYVRDQKPTTPLSFTVLRPDGSIFATWTSIPLSQLEPFTYWYSDITLPLSGAQGRWRAQVQLEGKTVEHVFMVGALPAATTLSTSVTPLTATATPSTPANFDILLRNTGGTPAISCSVAPDAPLRRGVEFSGHGRWNSQGAVNQAFDLAPGAVKKIRLTITPKATYRPTRSRSIRAFCVNGSEPAATQAKLVTLSF